MSKTAFAMLGSVALVAVLVWLMVADGASNRNAPASASTSADPASSASDGLHIYCAASNQAVLEPIRHAYEQLTGIAISVQYGPSQTLLAQSELTGRGDLYLPADESYLATASERGLVAEILPLATMQAGLVVKRGNPKGIDDLQALLADDVRLVQANPDAAAVGKITRELLTQAGTWEAVAAATTAFRGTVTEVTNDVQVGAADAGIVYDAVLHPYPDLEFVEIEALREATSKVSLGVLQSSQEPAKSLHFARFVAARDQGLKVYAEHGFRVAAGDPWAEVPELSIFAGSMLRPAIEETIVAFEEREGVLVSRVYNGCGILVAQMQAGQQPDAYFACDVEFMNQVQDIFPDPVDVSQNELVILVPKGNPRKIATLADLRQPDLRVGIGHEKQCAMGWITQNVFRESGMQRELMSNVTVQTPTGDMLVNQLRTGSLDAAVVYLSNAAGSAEHFDAVQIQGIPCSTATQPWAVAKGSHYPQLASRLFEMLISSDSQAIFTAEGFRWKKGL
ncbi:Putative binding protein precursor [Rosistilla ulvae]|uniref:Binding protein n=1 Tax=Rosistilla ulvae TaxID=1930277 RepID=A0A517LZT9_9BACT|nr:molybdate ABC transporter substrate-binding protein [Rosistilla ulvae]QDS88135.1 Putative binding protein precursor [Rosistilla ulvae]